MKTLTTIFAMGITTALFYAYKPAPEKTDINIVGTWEIVSFIDHQNGKSNWQSYPDKIIKQKHITTTHFTWFHYDTEEDRLEGLGGGTYMIDKEGRYVENIDFFYPPGSSELGQTIPFEMEFNDGLWYHTGYSKRMEINGKGVMISTDSVKIEEKWSPVASKFDNNKGLIGAWDLDRYRHKSDGPYMDYPKYMGYLKVLTPSHFIWVQYNKQGDEIYASGTGPYKYDGKKYIETLDMVHPSGSEMLGKTITFDIELNNNRWKHFGYIPQEDNQPNSDDNMIDEFWTPHKSTISEETAFMNE